MFADGLPMPLPLNLVEQLTRLVFSHPIFSLGLAAAITIIKVFFRANS